MLDSEWNFLWDKGSINDITPDGLVSDVADLFISDELEHQFGSVYSVLYSLHSMSRRKYNEFLACNDLEHIDKKSFVINAIKILEDNNIDTSPLFPHDNDKANYIHTVMYYLKFKTKVPSKKTQTISLKIFHSKGIPNYIFKASYISSHFNDDIIEFWI